MTLFYVKLLHTLIYAFMTACIGYIWYCAWRRRTDRWLGLAVLAVVGEGLVLLLNQGECPLKTVVARLAADTRVSDIFIPRWLADRTFPICFTLFAAGLAGWAVRVWRKPRP